MMSQLCSSPWEACPFMNENGGGVEGVDGVTREEKGGETAVGQYVK